MSYNLRGGSGLRGSSHSRIMNSGEDVNPMANVANISDTMLILSVGLMVALISFWNLDTTQLQEVVQNDQVTEVDVNQMADDMTSEGSSYQELGTVYQDPATGQLYMLTEDVDKGASNTGKSGKKSK